MKLSSLLCFGLIGGSIAFGQNYSKECKEADGLFPDADVVTLYKNYHLYITPQNDTVEFTSTTKEVNYIRKNSELHTSEFIYYSYDFDRISDLEAYTINPATSKKTKFAGASEGVYYDRNIFYDDNRETYFVYPNVEDKVVTEMQYKMKYSEPRLLPSYYFSFHQPVLHSSITVTFPKDCEIGWIVQDHGKYTIEMEQKTVKGKNEYTWKLTNTAILGKPTKDVAASKVLPHVIVWVKKYTTTKRTTSVLSNINDLYSWYSGFVDKAKTKKPDLVKTVSDSITRNISSEKQKAQAIFKWVQSNISYVAFEDGYSGFIPRKAEDVISKKYGDCKDMANLIVELMKCSGLDARHVWIGTRDIPYTYYDVYTPIVDNHMIAAIKLDDKFHFLDATGRFMPFGFPTSMIQGKIALIEEDSSKFVLEKVDVINPESNLIKDSVHLYITDRTLNGYGTYHSVGYPMINSKIALSYTTGGNSEKNYYKELLLKGNNKFKLVDYELSELKDFVDPVNIKYKFEMDDYISLGSSEIFVNMNIEKTSLLSLDKQEINSEAFSSNDYNYIKDDYFILSIPKDYKVDFIPSDKQIDHDFISYTSDYEIVDNKLILHRKLKINYLELNTDQITKFNTVISDIQKIERSNISLTK